jgi:hypothetical protein
MDMPRECVRKPLEGGAILSPISDGEDWFPPLECPRVANTSASKEVRYYLSTVFEQLRGLPYMDSDIHLTWSVLSK